MRKIFNSSNTGFVGSKLSRVLRHMFGFLLCWYSAINYTTNPAELPTILRTLKIVSTFTERPSNFHVTRKITLREALAFLFWIYLLFEIRKGNVFWHLSTPNALLWKQSKSKCFSIQTSVLQADLFLKIKPECSKLNYIKKKVVWIV